MINEVDPFFWYRYVVFHSYYSIFFSHENCSVKIRSVRRKGTWFAVVHFRLHFSSFIVFSNYNNFRQICWYLAKYLRFCCKMRLLWHFPWFYTLLEDELGKKSLITFFCYWRIKQILFKLKYQLWNCFFVFGQIFVNKTKNNFEFVNEMWILRIIIVLWTKIESNSKEHLPSQCSVLL